MLNLLLCLCVFASLKIVSECDTVEIDTRRDDGKLPHFWKSTGLSPPDPKSEIHKFLLSEDERINLALIGALPNKGIEQVRIHWLINLITYQNGKFNFTHMDELMDWLHFNHLKPGFELMGTPIGIDGNLVKNNIYHYWADLTYQISSRYAKRYGMNVVKTWRFETWNEPDLKMYNTYNFSLSQFVEYIRGCEAGLKKTALKFRGNNIEAVNLKLGGPAGLFKHPIQKHRLCWGALDFCNHTCPLQFLSFHKKGEGSPGNVIKEGLQLIDEIHLKYPKLKHLPIANDEADILKTWSKDEEWRGDAAYAAMVTSVIIDHYEELINKRKLKIEVLSNDNGFMNYNPYFFTQRTLSARFQMNNTNPPHLQFVQKPVYSAMALLSFSGRTYLKTQTVAPLRMLATKEADSRIAIIMAFLKTGVEDEIKIPLDITLLDGEWKYAVYTIDNIRSNPYGVWKENGSPVFPNDDVLRKMRLVQEPFRLAGPSLVEFSKPNFTQITFKMKSPAVAFVNICTKTNTKMGAPGRLFAITIRHDKILLFWKDKKVNNKCLKTYEVEFSETEKENGFRRINVEDIIFLSYYYYHRGNHTSTGFYRVRAVYYFNRKSPYSKILKL